MNGTPADSTSDEIPMAFLKSFNYESWVLVVEDDDCVAYAYLLDGDQLVSDVWLYNHGTDPVVPPWKSGAEMPFQNPVDFTGGQGGAWIPDQESLGVKWTGRGGLDRVEVYFGDQLFAWLQAGHRPGWSTRVRRSGPLAKLPAEDEAQ